MGNHSYRATGITAYLANGGVLEHAQEMALPFHTISIGTLIVVASDNVLVETTFGDFLETTEPSGEPGRRDQCTYLV
jgi:hypothetical protein